MVRSLFNTHLDASFNGLVDGYIISGGLLYCKSYIGICRWISNIGYRVK